ncbi:MAG: hypothetical protein NVSMB53_01120 [Gemmatimonadaceae bacterium]
MEVIERSGCSENPNRIEGGELVMLDPEAGSLRLSRACAQAGPDTGGARAREPTAALYSWLGFILECDTKQFQAA